MAYDNEKLNFGKEHIYIVDLLLTGCTQTSGVPPCLATETGDNKCFNTLETCNFLDAYTPSNTVNFLRFYQSRSPSPIGLFGSTDIDPIPNLKSVNIAPTKIDLAGGLGVRASVTCTFTDHPHSDIGIDKYVDDRTYIASDRGSFWTKLRARNPDYQNRELRVLSGFLVDGVFDVSNFKTRYYIVDKMTVSNGMCTIVAKDPLKLVSSKKALAPAASTGRLSSDISAGATSAVLTPSGIGADTEEYPLSGKILINSEVIEFSRSAGSDTLNLTGGRGANNTIASDHSSDDTVQLCLEYIGKQVDFIVKDLLINYANIDPVFIQDTAWTAEINKWLQGSLSGIVVKPFDVFKLLKELAESMPHYLWWDENEQQDGQNGGIQLTALKPPPDTLNTINMDANIIAGSFKTSDKPELRKSTVFVNFGQFDPTKRLDEFSNYQQTYARVDTGSISKYGSNEIKTINSRWISNTDKATAIDIAALIGRRFSDIPREVSFSLEVKDSSVWVGQSINVNHRDIVDFTGEPIDTTFQLLSSKEGKNFDHTGIEFTYGEALPDDPDPTDNNIILGGNERNINLRSIFDIKFPFNPPTSTSVVNFTIDDNAIIGSTSTNPSVYSLDTGSWPDDAVITLELNNNAFVVGKGGEGGDGTFDDGGDGGCAIILNNDLTLINNGVIGGGGGGGGNSTENIPGTPFSLIFGGGGGAGDQVGLGGQSVNTQGTNGTLEFGGSGGLSSPSHDGGDLGQDGENGTTSTGGTAGLAINKNGFNLTETVLGVIEGDIQT